MHALVRGLEMVICELHMMSPSFGCNTESRIACTTDETVSGYAAAVDADDPTEKRKIEIPSLIAVAQKAFNGTSDRATHLSNLNSLIKRKLKNGKLKDVNNFKMRAALSLI